MQKIRKTKIICTIGPACEDEATLTAMFHAGMNIARLNFSHGTHQEHIEKINRIKKIRDALDMPVGIMLDTKGPEYRIKTFTKGKVTLKAGATFTFTTRDVEGTKDIVSVSYAGLANDLSVGDQILVANGLLSFEVVKTTDTDVVCTVLIGGELSNRKSMSFPGKVLNQVYLSEQDKADLALAVTEDVDYIACSFVSRKQDLLDVKAHLASLGAKGIELIAKIENQSGIDNIEEICEACDGIMIGRGDMGVEIPFEQLPSIQKKLITKCRLLGKRVITATEMLESMIHNPRPTRAETSDVANAVYDGTSAIMLSGETAAGKYPVKAVATMAKIALESEQNINYKKRFYSTEFRTENTIDAISHATCGMSIDLDAKAIVVCSLSGMTARMVSRFRSPVDILAVTTSQKTRRQLSLSWGVTPVVCEYHTSSEVLFYQAKRLAIEKFGLQPGDKIVITGGLTNGSSGNTNMLKIEIV